MLYVLAPVFLSWIISVVAMKFCSRLKIKLSRLKEGAKCLMLLVEVPMVLYQAITGQKYSRWSPLFQPVNFAGSRHLVTTLDNAIHQINFYPADSVVGFVNTYLLDIIIHLSNNWGLLDKTVSNFIHSLILLVR